MIPVIPLPKLLNSDGTEKRRLRPLLVRIQEKTVPLSTATITLKKDDVPNEREYIELFTVNGSAGVYRVKAPAVQYGGNGVSVSLEHSICGLGDYLVRNKEDAQQQKTLAAAVQHFFSYYNGGKWRLGSVSVSGNVIVQDSYQTVLTAINGAVAQVNGARLAYDFTTTPWTLNIVGRETTVTAEGRLSRNVEDATISKNDTELCTRVWMDGLGNDGAIGYMDADTKSVYGIIEKYVATSGYTQAQAQIAAAAYLSAHKRPRYSVSLNAISLVAITGESFDQIRIGKLYRLAIPDDGVVIEENVIDISWPDVYGKPLSCTVTLSEPGYTAVSFLQQQQAQNESIQTSYSNSTNQKISDQQADLNLIWRKTGIDSLGQSETLMTRIQANAEGIQTEVTRATGVEASKLDKSQDYQTVNDLISEAQSLADAAATSAKNASIAKTAQYQTADAIVATAVATGISEGNQRYIAQTTSFQTADAIKNEAVRVSGNNAAAAYIAKSDGYNTVNQIISQAETLAQEAATSAKNASIAKTSRYQTADAIVESAVSIAEDDAGNTYIAKTYQYQTADEICQVAEQYTDTQVSGVSTTLGSRIQQNSDKIALVVTQSAGQDVVNTASIVAGINSAAQGGGSYIKLHADTIDIDGIVNMTEARVLQSVSRWLTVETLHVQQNFQFGPDGQEARFGPTNITVGGTTYTVLAVVH